MAITAGTAVEVSHTSSAASLSCGAASGGTAPYTYQWYRSTTPAFTPGGGSLLSGATSLTLCDIGLTAETKYYYVCRATDAVAATADSNEVGICTDASPSAVALYANLRISIADYLGWTRSSGNWSADEISRLDEIINAGYLQFIYPVPLQNEATAHRWSFLRPTATLTTAADQYLYDLPSSFGAMVGDLVYDEAESVHGVIEQTTPGMIDRNRACNSAAGRPHLFALRPKTVGMASAQVTELMLYPTPDAIYEIVYHYDAKVDPLSASNAYPLGGQAHSETILQSCRDVAAARYKDDAAGREHAMYLERLRASVEADRRLSPKTLGFNEDGRKFTHLRHGSDFTVSLKHNLG